MDFPKEVPSIPTFPITCPKPKSNFERRHGLLLLQSLCQTELPGEDMVRHANRFLERDLIDIVTRGSIKATAINAQGNRQYTIDFVKCYISPPFYTNAKKKHEKLDLETCRKLRVSYNLGVWADLEFRTKTFATVEPLRTFRRDGIAKCFYAPCLYLDATSDDPRTSTTGFVCRRLVKDGPQAVYDARLEVEFEAHVLQSFHEDQTNRQNANSSNVINADTYVKQLWSQPIQKFDRQVWKPRRKPAFHMLHKNMVMIGKYDVETKVFRVQRMGMKSRLRGKVVHTAPPYIEQCDELFESETVDAIPNVLLLQLPCMVGSSICWTRRDTRKPFRYDSSVMHAGTCERVVMCNTDFRTDVCHIKDLGNNAFEGVLRSTHDIRKSLRSTSATSVFVSPAAIDVVLPFLTTTTDKPLLIHIVEFVKILLDLPKTADGEPPSQCTNLTQLLDILTAKVFTKVAVGDADLRGALKTILTTNARTQALLKEKRSSILLRLGALGSRQLSKARQVKAIVHTVHNECLPHLGVHGTAESRRFKLFHVVKDILLPTLKVYLGKALPTHIHSLRSKEVNGYANIIGIMFRQSFLRFRKSQLGAIYEKTSGNVVLGATTIHAMFHDKRRFENIVYYGFNTGNVLPSQKKKGNLAKAEKTPQPAVETILAANTEGKIGTIRRFHVAHSKKNYSAAQRLLHPSQWHFVCPAEVPEGERCGLVMNFCIGVRTTVGYMALEEALAIAYYVLRGAANTHVAPTLDQAVQLFTQSEPCTSVLYINHVMVGKLDSTNLANILQALKQARSYGMFHYEVSIYGLNSDIMIETSKGRLLRPLIKASFLQNNIFDQVFQACIDTHVPLWQAMEDRHIIEFVSPHEIEDQIDVLVAAEDAKAYYKEPERYTHVEVDKLFMYSNMAANSTLQERNACVRTSYACKHRSQAAAARPLYTESAPEASKLSLDYPQTPLVETAMNRLTNHTMQIEAMTECVIGIVEDLQAAEDGILISKSFLERGGMRITKTQDFFVQAKAHHYIMVPPMGTRGIKAANYAKLDVATGMVKKGTKIEFNDVLAGIVLKESKKSEALVYSDKSIVYSKHLPGVVTRVESMKTRYGVESYTITIALTGVSQVQVGDKLASPYSQKSVVVGIVPQEDMPVVAYGPNAGMPLDLKYNCHGIPTRMTGATTDAPFYGMYAAKFGKRVNATAFQMATDESREAFTKRMGGDGKVWMLNPRTGQVFPERMFVGIASYMRLNHLVAEKCHARNGGPVDNYRQPKAGKANKGGLRMGKMEKTATEGHGASEFTYERTFVMSDRSVAYFCEKCSSINGEPPLPGQTMGLCRRCHDPHSCRKVEIPYATIAFLNYMEASGMPITFKLEPDDIDEQCLGAKLMLADSYYKDDDQADDLDAWTTSEDEDEDEFMF